MLIPWGHNQEKYVAGTMNRLTQKNTFLSFLRMQRPESTGHHLPEFLKFPCVI